MLDDNLPAFILAPASDNLKHHETIYLTRLSSEPEPAYFVDHGDPASPSRRNCYGAALFDSYNTDVLFGEVLLRPGWAQPTLSQDEIRKNGGVPPPPEPTLPYDFTIQLYNPDQQVIVKEKPGSLVSSPHWDFQIPQSTFRAPSLSALDRAQHDPVADATVPKINFSWKQSKLSKDLTCYVTGKSTDLLGKKRNKEPDISVAHFRSFKEITIYEPNLARVEMEDPKGLEVVFMLSALVIRDVYYGSLRKAFHITEPLRQSSGGAGAAIAPIPSSAQKPLLSTRSSTQAITHPSSTMAASLPLRPAPNRTAGVPPADERTQWEIDAETARLKAQVVAEEREHARAQEMRRREQERAADAETRRLRREMEEEKRERSRERRRIDQETERLRRLYGQQGQVSVPPQMLVPPAALAAPPPPPPGAQTYLMSGAAPPPRPHSAQSYGYGQQQYHQPQAVSPYHAPQPQRLTNGLYVQPEASGSNSGRRGKKSTRDLRASDDRKLGKKSSSLW